MTQGKGKGGKREAGPADSAREREDRKTNSSSSVSANWCMHGLADQGKVPQHSMKPSTTVISCCLGVCWQVEVESGPS